jgi:hypothetical protein
MDTDAALATGTICSLILCCVCGIGLAYRRTFRLATPPMNLKPSRSDNDLENMLPEPV